MTWGFIWLMFILKIPIIGLLGIVWWAARAEPDPDEHRSDDGGSRRHPHRRPPRWPRPPRRGPHGAPPVPAPPRMRTRAYRARQLD